MSILTLIRHGQASYLSEDYDKLSALGERQARMLGEHWTGNGIRFDEVYYGPRNRQIRTGEIVRECFGSDWPEPVIVNEFDEYRAEELYRYCLPELARTDPRIGELAAALQKASLEDRPRAFEHIFQEMTRRWVVGEIGSPRVEPWAAFRERVHSALARIRASAKGGSRIAVFTSAGPISTAVQLAVDLSDTKALELSWLARNASCTDFLFSGERFSLGTFNTHTHLNRPDLITYR
jgi:broad specificity phosphatase PhoE